MLAAVRIRSTVKKRSEIIATLKLLRLNRNMHCVLLPETPQIKGMLQKAKDFITFGPISDEMLSLLIKKRARKKGNKRLSEKEAEEIISKIKSGEKIKNLAIKPVFRLTPPSGGFKKSIRLPYPRGEAGNRGEKINELLKRMI